MRWRDIRFEKPTKADRKILVTQENGEKRFRVWHCLDGLDGVAAWLPISELRQPDLPG
jgi:hypothetical protein